MSLRERIATWVATQRGPLFALCENLVRIPSADPPGDTRAVCNYLTQYLRERGVCTSVHAVDPSRPNIFGTIDLRQPGETVVLNGHMETLPVGDAARWTRDPLGGEAVSGRLYGRGAYCMKAGLAALLTAGLAVRDHGGTPRGRIVLAFASDEVNAGSLGTAHLLQTVPEARGHVALVGESSLGINFGHKGVIFAEFVARGDAGHGAYGFAKASAIDRMLELAAQLRHLETAPVAPPAEIRSWMSGIKEALDAAHGKGATDALMRVSVNVGRIAGGHKVNLVAEECTAQVDFRLPPGATVHALLETIETLLESRPWISLRVLSSHDPTFSLPDHPWFRALQQASREVLGEPMLFTFSHGFTDARFFRDRRIPTAALGVKGGNVGAPDEYVDLESVLQTTQIVALAVHEYLSSGNT